MSSIEDYKIDLVMEFLNYLYWYQNIIHKSLCCILYARVFCK